MEVTQAGGNVEMEVWAILTGSNGSGNDEGLSLVAGKFLSTDVGGGAVRGDLSGAVESPFNISPASGGGQEDLDGDGDLDLGKGNDTDPDFDWFAARAGQLIHAGGTVDGASRSFKVGTLSLAVSSLLPGEATQINFLLPTSSSVGIWSEDGVLKVSSKAEDFATISAGTPVVLTSIPGEDLAKPQAELFIDDLTEGGGTWHYLEVDYTDDIAVRLDTLGDGDLVVVTPNGAKLPVFFIDASRTTDGTPVTASYWFDAPGGYFDSLDNGQYAVWLKPNQVSDLSGKFADGWTNLGAFAVNVPPAIKKAKWLIVNGTNGKDKITLSKQDQSLVATVNGEPYTFSAAAINNIQIFGFNNNDIITVGSGVGAANVDGGAGNDRIYGGDGNDSLNGGAGDDLLVGGLGDDTLLGGAGKDKLYGQAGNDALNGGSGLDLMYGDDGNDLFIARDRELDTLFGGQGADSVRGDRNDLLTQVENILK
jgi:Ca2+-binding RTX toxin-like protein